MLTDTEIVYDSCSHSVLGNCLAKQTQQNHNKIQAGFFNVYKQADSKHHIERQNSEDPT